MALQSSANRLHPATTPRTRVPGPQRVRVMQKFASGKSIVQIAKEENRNRETVSRIVHSEEMHAHVERMREKFYGLADLAIAAVQQALEDGDAQVGYRILLDMGVIPSPEQRMQIQAAPAANDPNQGFKDQMAKAAEIMVERMKIYGVRFDEFGVEMNRESGELQEIAPK